MKITLLTMLYAVLVWVVMIPSVVFLFIGGHWELGIPMTGLFAWLMMGFIGKWRIPTYKNLNGKREV